MRFHLFYMWFPISGGEIGLGINRNRINVDSSLIIKMLWKHREYNMDFIHGSRGGRKRRFMNVDISFDLQDVMEQSLKPDGFYRCLRRVSVEAVGPCRDLDVEAFLPLKNHDSELLGKNKTRNKLRRIIRTLAAQRPHYPTKEPK